MPTPDFQLLGLDHIVLRVRDMAAVQGFYIGVLGCSIERVQQSLGLIQLRAGHSLIDLVSVDGVLGQRGGAAPGATARNVDHFALAIAPFDETAIRTHLQAHGVAVVESGQRYGAGGEGPSVYIHDPEGNIVELKGATSSDARTAVVT